jgi:tetratricopeptide (TPR) repeat protein
MDWGWRLAELRAENDNMSLRALAFRTKISYTYLWKIENRVRPGTVKIAERCDEALGSGSELADLAKLADDSSVFGPNLLPALRMAGRSDVDRRAFLRIAASSIAASAVTEVGAAQRLGERDVLAIRDMIAQFSRLDQRHGGGHARRALTQYFYTDVVEALAGTFRSDSVKRQLFSAAAEASYLVGWMAFDDGRQEEARKSFELATKLAGEVNDAALAGHVLRAMAHQAIDLGLRAQALRFSSMSAEGDHFRRAVPRERALIGVVHARALVANGEHKAAVRSLNRAEKDLAAASSDDDEPDRVFFFQEASLAHETACALRDMGDLKGAIGQFNRSVEARKASAFTRTHSVTLGYLAETHALNGDLDEACATWAKSLDAMDGIRSGRTRKILETMSSSLHVNKGFQGQRASELRERAAEMLSPH